MREVKLTPPVTENQTRDLVCGDVVFLDGTVFAFRDRAIERILEFTDCGEELPMDLEGSVHWQCGPVVREDASGWTVVSAGPTGSPRFGAAEARIIEELGVRILVGKGGLSAETRDALLRKGAVYLAAVGGVGSLYAKQIEAVRQVYWLDLGPLEALWMLHMKDFGPLLVAIDSRGKSLYDDVHIEENLKKVLSEIQIEPD